MKTLPKVINISDDLTGANDTGVQFAKQGLSTVSLLDLSANDHIPESDIWGESLQIGGRAIRWSSTYIK